MADVLEVREAWTCAWKTIDVSEISRQHLHEVVMVARIAKVSRRHSAILTLSTKLFVHAINRLSHMKRIFTSSVLIMRAGKCKKYLSHWHSSENTQNRVRMRSVLF